MNLKMATTVLLAFGTLLGGATVAAAQDDSAAYTIEDVTACSADAMRLCRDKLPDIDNIEACMKAHYDQLKPKCQARFKR